MKAFQFSFLLVALSLLTLPAFGQSEASQLLESRAAAGEPIAVWISHVHADKRAQFDEFLEAFWATGDAALAEGQLEQPEADAYQRVRVLKPAESSPDGTYPYVFLADPYLPGSNYSIIDLLRLRHDEAEAQRIYALYTGSLAAPQQSLIVVQARH